MRRRIAAPSMTGVDPLTVGEGGRGADRVRGYDYMGKIVTPHPPRSARHLLPQGEGTHGVYAVSTTPPTLSAAPAAQVCTGPHRPSPHPPVTARTASLTFA